MKSNNPLILSTSPLSQPARKLRRTASLTHRQRPLYGRKRHHPTGKERDTETGLYYYGARYLDGKTSRWLSGDPAVGEYIPSAPVNDEARKRNGNLPGQGGVFNYVNLHMYHYAGNNPVKLVDPNGRNLDERTIADAEADIQKTAEQTSSLKNLINTKNLAGIMVQNRSALDKDTNRFISRLGFTDKKRTEKLEALLNNVTVYAGVDADLTDNIVSNLTGGNQGFLDGLSIGNNIYMRETIGTVDQDTAGLLGHEAVHCIQATAVGKIAFANYSANMSYTDANKYELAAYKFGGGVDLRDFPGLRRYYNNQILTNSGKWW